jgi:hypothetical protein
MNLQPPIAGGGRCQQALLVPSPERAFADAAVDAALAPFRQPRRRMNRHHRHAQPGA